MTHLKLTVTGMHCPKCDARVEKAVGALDGVTSVSADHETDAVELDYDGSEQTRAAVKEAIEALDFTVEG